MSPFQIGVMMPIIQQGADRLTNRWPEIRRTALHAEEIGFDTVWVPDELLWRTDDGDPRGVWDGVSMMGAVAAITSRVTIGSWVLAALHRNPGIIAKTAETVDEISSGRFIFGLGAGHVWPGQAHAFGLPEDHVFDRFEESLEVIIPLLRGGYANFEGQFHAARDLPQRPVGPRPNAIPILIGGNGPRGQRAAARYANIYSSYIEERAEVEEAVPRLASLDAICDELGRDPATLERSIGVSVNPIERRPDQASVISGSVEEIADRIRSFRDAGFTRLEIMPSPGTPAVVEALARVLEAVRAD